MTSLLHEDNIDMMPSGGPSVGEECCWGTVEGHEGGLTGTTASRTNFPGRCSVAEPLAGKGSTDVTSGSKDDRKTSKQKKIKMAVIVVTLVLVLTSVILVGVTLSMSGHIDDMVRQRYDGSSSTQKPQVNSPSSQSSGRRR